MDKINEHGHWWLPGQKDASVSGQIEYTPKEGVKLELVDSLLDKDSEPNEFFTNPSSNKLPRIHGYLSNQKYATVENPLRVSQDWSPENQSVSETYRSTRVFIGDNIEGGERYSRLQIKNQKILKWANESVVDSVLDTESVALEEINDRKIEQLVAVLEPYSYDAELNDCTVSLKFSISGEYSTYSTNLNTDGYIQIRCPEPERFDELWDRMVEVMSYISLSIGDGLYPEEILVYDEDLCEGISVYQQFDNISKAYNPTKLDYLFQPDEENFEKTLIEYLNHRESAPTFHEKLSQILYGPDLIPSLEFLTIVIALEAYHDNKYADRQILEDSEFERFRQEVMDATPENPDIENQMRGLLNNVINQPSLKSKLEVVVEEDCPPLSKLIETDSVLTEARDRRHDIAHGLQSIDQQEITRLSQKLRLIVDAIVLTEMGIDEGRIIQSLAERYQAILAESPFAESTSG